MKIPKLWILVFLAITAIVIAIIFTQPEIQEDITDTLLENDASPRVQNFENMLLSGEDAIFVDDQKSGNNEVVVGLVVLSQPGFVVVHKDDDGLPGEIIGSSIWLEGEVEDFYVSVSESLETDAIYYAVLYADNGDQEFNASVDKMTENESGAIVLMTFTANE